MTRHARMALWRCLWVREVRYTRAMSASFPLATSGTPRIADFGKMRRVVAMYGILLTSRFRFYYTLGSPRRLRNHHLLDYIYAAKKSCAKPVLRYVIYHRQPKAAARESGFLCISGKDQGCISRLDRSAGSRNPKEQAIVREHSR